MQINTITKKRDSLQDKKNFEANKNLNITSKNKNVENL